MDNRIIRKILPNLFTLGNLLCGFLAVVNVVEGVFVSAAWWIIIAGIFDALDGKIARLTGGSSEFGIEFDSIADVVSFGIAPAVLFYQYALAESGIFGYFLSFCFLAAGGLRLARFNIHATTDKKHFFTGMPIPAGAGILASFILFSENVWGGISHFDLSIVLIVLTSLAMLSNFKYRVLPKIGFASKTDKLKSALCICYIAFLGCIRAPTREERAR